MNAAVGEEPTPSAPEPATPGELLRRERETRGLSVQQAAEELHLDTAAINALEGNRFASLGAPVYAKGYLRKYALVLGVSPETVIARYEALNDTPPVPVPAPTQQLHVERVSLKMPLWIVGSLIAAAMLVWLASWLLDRDSASPPTVTPPEPEQSSTTVSPPAPSTDVPTIIATPPAQSAPENPAPSTPAPIETASASVAGPQVRLRLEFSETSWTEVHDATGRRLMFGLGEPGRVRNLAGVAPLRVTLGAASAVTAQVNDEPVVIPRRAGRDATKFVIGVDGKVAASATTPEQ